MRLGTESLAITESLCESDGLTFGECNAAQLEITVADVLQDLTGLEFVATVEVGGYELMLVVYIVKSFVRQADRRKKKITAYNRMEKFLVDVAEWYQSLNSAQLLRIDCFCYRHIIKRKAHVYLLDTNIFAK